MTASGDLLATDWRRLLLGDNGQPHITGERILADLTGFCRGRSSVPMLDAEGQIDPLKLACLEGRRQVLFRILNFLEPPKDKPEPQTPRSADKLE